MSQPGFFKVIESIFRQIGSSFTKRIFMKQLISGAEVQIGTSRIVLRREQVCGRQKLFQPGTVLFLQGNSRGFDLLGGGSEERRSRDAEEAEVVVDLAAMMDFVLGHGAEEDPDGNLRAGGSGAEALEVGVGEAGEDFAGFGVEAFEEGEDVVETVGELFVFGGVAVGMAEDGFGEHEAFGDGDVAEEIAGGEFSGGAGGFEFVRGDAAGGADGAFVNAVDIFEEGLDRADFHGRASVAGIMPQVFDLRQRRSWRAREAEKVAAR
jgi:hypothetical protein